MERISNESDIRLRAALLVGVTAVTVALILNRRRIGAVMQKYAPQVAGAAERHIDRFMARTHLRSPGVTGAAQPETLQNRDQLL